MALQLYLGKVAIDGAMTAGSPNLVSGFFFNFGLYVGSFIDVLGAGLGGATLITTILSGTLHTAVLADAASVTVGPGPDDAGATITVYVPFLPDRGSLSLNNTLTARDTFAFAGRRSKNTHIPVVGAPVLLLDTTLGDLFGGSIEELDTTNMPGSTDAYFSCQCVSWDALASKRNTGQPNDFSIYAFGNPHDGTFSGMPAGWIFQWLALHCLNSDVSRVSVVTGPIIAKITFDFAMLSDAFDQVCQAASSATDTYIWRTDARRNLYLELQTSNLSPWDISDSDALEDGSLVCTQTRAKYVNWVTVKPTTTTSGGIVDSSAVVNYTNESAVDEASGREGGTGFYQLVTDSGTDNAATDPTTLAQAIGTTYGKIQTTISYTTFRGGLRSGMVQHIVLTNLGISGYFLIDSVTMSAPNGAPVWQIEAVDGPLLGDWRTALANLANGTSGFGEVAGGGGVVGRGFPLPWSPGYVAPLDGDASYPEGILGPGNFGVQPVRGNGTLALAIKGSPSINKLSALVSPVLPPSIACVAGTSGSLAPGTYVVAVTAFDTSVPYANTKYSNLETVTIPPHAPGPDTGSIDLTVMWQAGSNGGDVYMASPDSDSGFHLQAGLAAGVTTATLTVFDQSTAGGVDPLFDHFGVKWKKIIHGGDWAQQVQPGTTATTITIADPNNGMTVNQWAGQTLSLLAKYDLTLEIPILNMPVASNTASSGGLFTLTIGPNSAGVQLPDLTTLLAVGDLLVMRGKTRFTPYGYSDENIANSYYPNGMDGTGPTGVEAGHMAMVMTGPDAGDVQTVASVSLGLGGHYTVINLAGAWNIQPNDGDVVIIVEAAYSPEVKSDPFVVSNKDFAGLVALPNVLSLPGYTAWLFVVVTEDANDASGLDSFAPMRELYLLGAGGADEGYNLITPVAGHATPDLAMGLNQELILTADAIIDGSVHASGPTTWTLLIQWDATGGWQLSFDPAAYVDGAALGPKFMTLASTRSTINFIHRADGKEEWDGTFKTGGSIT